MIQGLDGQVQESSNRGKPSLNLEFIENHPPPSFVLYLVNTI